MFKSVIITAILILIAIAGPSYAQVFEVSSDDRLFQALWAQDQAQAQAQDQAQAQAQAQASLAQGANRMAKDTQGNPATDVAVAKALLDSKRLKPKPKSKPALDSASEEKIPDDYFVVKNDPFASSAPTQSNLTPAGFPYMAEDVLKQEPKPKIQVRSQPQPAPKPKPEPQPKPQPKPKPEPEPEPEPELDPIDFDKPITAPVDIGPFITEASGFEQESPPRLAQAVPQGRKISHRDMNAALGVGLGKFVPVVKKKKPKKCIKKGQQRTICIEQSNWSDGIFEHFSDLPISIYKRFHKGNRAVVGYHKGVATYVKTIFAAPDFDAVMQYFTKKYGTPDTQDDRVVAPLGKPQQTNVVLTWYGYSEAFKRETVLQVAHYDVSQHRFSNMSEGSVVYKFYNEPSVFSYVNPIELVRLP